MLDILAQGLSEDQPVGRTILNWPGDPIADALALRMAGAMHALMLTGASTDLVDAYPPTPLNKDKLSFAVDAALRTHGKFIIRFVESPPQTNEVARAAALAGGFLTIAALTSLPLAVFEIGASAGLNLLWDRFAYDLGGLTIGGAADLPRLTPLWKGPAPPATKFSVGERAGCDRAPIDVRSIDDVLRLRAYIWPDQSDRLARLEQALAIAGSSSLRIARADAADWASLQLTRRREGVATTLFHSIVWQYIDEASRERLERTIEDAGRRADKKAPFAWLRMEPETSKAAALRLNLWPSGDTIYLADVDYHGSWINWRIEPDTLHLLSTS